jgi:DNA polymerase-3 subunit beta
MKFSISRETLLKNLTYMQSVVEKRTSIAILSNVRLTAKDNKLETTATDNDITVQGSAEAFVETEGVTTVSAHKLYEIIRKTPEGVMVEVEVTPEGDRMSVKAGKAKFSLACLNADAFPDMTKLDDGCTFKINGKDLKRALTKAIFSASTEDTRQYLNGIYMHVTTCKDGNPCLRFVATDGHRLSQVDLALPEGAEDVTATILPRKTVGELKALCDEGTDLTLRVSDKKIQAEAGSLTMTSKVIDGTFPDYSRVIPTDNTMEMDVSRQLLLQAVDRVAILSHEKSRSIKFTIDGANLVISANNPDQENAMEELKVEYDADRVDVGFNARYVADIGGQIEGDDIQFFFKDSASPVLVKDPKDTSSLFVVMPMRI